MSELPKPSLVEVFDYYELRILGADRGGWRKAVCPLPDHEDANPSASLNEDKCRWYCHTCARGGDALDIIMEREGFAGLTGAIQFAARFTDGGDGAVREERGSSSLVPRRPGRKPRGGRSQPPWMRF